MHLIARKSSEQRCSLFQGQIQYYHKHFLLYVFQVNDYRHSTQYHWDSRERRQKKEVYSSRRIPFSQDSTKSQNWVREKKNQQTTCLWILNT